jgi:DNA-binding response OmpR family regulator
MYPRPSVLVVEDDAGLRLALEAGLASEGFAVECAPDAGTAERRVTEVRPDVVLLDWTLPDGGGGARTCERLCNAHPDGAVVMLTGRSDAEAERAAREAGARAFIIKGIALGALADELRRLLAARAG